MYNEIVMIHRGLFTRYETVRMPFFQARSQMAKGCTAMSLEIVEETDVV